MAGGPERVLHPVLGELAWDGDRGHWSAVHTPASGGSIDLIVEPAAGDRRGCLPRAAELFRRALDRERAVFSEAVRAYLLDLYNDGWRQEGDPVLPADEFAAALEWQVLTIAPGGSVPVEFGYDPGELFGGHSVWVRADADLRFRSAHLVG